MIFKQIQGSISGKNLIKNPRGIIKLTANTIQTINIGRDQENSIRGGMMDGVQMKIFPNFRCYLYVIFDKEVTQFFNKKKTL